MSPKVVQLVLVWFSLGGSIGIFNPLEAYPRSFGQLMSYSSVLTPRTKVFTSRNQRNIFPTSPVSCLLKSPFQSKIFKANGKKGSQTCDTPKGVYCTQVSFLSSSSSPRQSSLSSVGKSLEQEAFDCNRLAWRGGINKTINQSRPCLDGGKSINQKINQVNNQSKG